MIVFLGSTPIEGPLSGWLSQAVATRAALVMAGIAAIVGGLLARVAFDRVAQVPADRHARAGRTAHGQNNGCGVRQRVARVRPAVSDPSELSIRGRIATSSDSDWDEVRQPWNLAVDQRPEAVALVESADDASKVIRFARENGLKVTAQGPAMVVVLGTLDGLYPDQDQRMRGVAIEGERRRARRLVR